tara:strand:+ start:44 stop:958 length:915 start_codon:yes stop_codon:yes gene_type:complete
MTLKVLTTFCGCGGLDYGFHKHAEFKVVKAYDTMQHAVDTYNINYPHEAEVMDVKELLKQDFDMGVSPDVIVGGPPCQDFSVAGSKNLGERASLTETFVDLVVKYKPKYFVMENVPTIKTIGKVVYDKITAKLKESGYGLTTQVIYMPDYGVPQGRKRLVIMGCMGGQEDAFKSIMDGLKTPVKSMKEYMDRNNTDLGLGGKSHIYRHPCNYGRRGVFSVDEVYPTVRGCLRRMPPTYNFHEGDTSHVRDEIAMPDWSIVAKIQTFPDDFQLLPKNNALIIGNAVPPKFSEAVAKAIATHHTSP